MSPLLGNSEGVGLIAPPSTRIFKMMSRSSKFGAPRTVTYGAKMSQRKKWRDTSLAVRKVSSKDGGESGGFLA